MKILSLNLNRHQQAARQRVLLRKHAANVLCLQEARSECVEYLESLGYWTLFAPQWKEVEDGKEYLVGSLIASLTAPCHHHNFYYRGAESYVPEFDSGQISQMEIPRAVQLISVEADGRAVSILNTHFTWSSNGVPSEIQRADAKRLNRYLGGLADFLLVGDMNAPWGGEVSRLLRKDAISLIPNNYPRNLRCSLIYAGELKIIFE